MQDVYMHYDEDSFEGCPGGQFEEPISHDANFQLCHLAQCFSSDALARQSILLRKVNRLLLIVCKVTIFSIALAIVLPVSIFCCPVTLVSKRFPMFKRFHEKDRHSKN